MTPHFKIMIQFVKYIIVILIYSLKKFNKRCGVIGPCGPGGPGGHFFDNKKSEISGKIYLIYCFICKKAIEKVIIVI